MSFIVISWKESSHRFIDFCQMILGCLAFIQLLILKLFKIYSFQISLTCRLLRLDFLLFSFSHSTRMLLLTVYHSHLLIPHWPLPILMTTIVLCSFSFLIIPFLHSNDLYIIVILMLLLLLVEVHLIIEYLCGSFLKNIVFIIKSTLSLMIKLHDRFQIIYSQMWFKQISNWLIIASSIKLWIVLEIRCLTEGRTLNSFTKSQMILLFDLTEWRSAFLRRL